MSDGAGEERPPRGFKRFRDRAEALAKDPAAVSELLDTAVRKVKTVDTGRFERLRADFLAMVRLIQAAFKGDYKKVPWTLIISALGGVLYFVNPFDVIPDFLLGPGFLDDATVVAFCLRAMQRDLKEFLKWEESRGQTQQQAPAP